MSYAGHIEYQQVYLRPEVPENGKKASKWPKKGPKRLKSYILRTVYELLLWRRSIDVPVCAWNYYYKVVSYKKKRVYTFLRAKEILLTAHCIYIYAIKNAEFAFLVFI